VQLLSVVALTEQAFGVPVKTVNNSDTGKLQTARIRLTLARELWNKTLRRKYLWRMDSGEGA
jgi:hypothetical protein